MFLASLYYTENNITINDCLNAHGPLIGTLLRNGGLKKIIDNFTSLGVGYYMSMGFLAFIYGTMFLKC